MTDIITNSFTTYDLTDEQVLQGSILNESQLQVIQNHLATAAEEKIALKYDPNDKEVYLQQEAELTARINCYQNLLDNSIASLEVLTTRTTNPSGEL